MQPAFSWETVASLWSAPSYATIILGVFLQLDRHMVDEQKLLDKARLLLETCRVRRAELLREFMDEAILGGVRDDHYFEKDPFVAFLHDSDRYVLHERSLSFHRSWAHRLHLAAKVGFLLSIAGLLSGAWFSQYPAVTLVLGSTGVASQVIAIFWLSHVHSRLNELEVDTDFKERRRP